MSLCVNRPLRGGLWAVLAALSLALLGCGPLPFWGDVQLKPDVTDNIRNQDLLPRFPQGGGQSGQNSGASAKPQIFTGEEVSPVEGPQPVQTTANGQGYELNFENAPIASVAKTVLGDILKVGYTIDPRVQGTISLASGRPVPRSDLLFVFETALRLTGVAMVRDTVGYRLIPIGDAVAGGNMDSAVARAEPGYGISVAPLQYISATTLIRLLDSFATKPGAVRVDTARNMLLVQGTGAERRAAIETALSFDVDWMRGQSVGIFPVQNSNPEPVIAELEKILDSKEGGFSQDIVKFQVMARRNAILAVTSKPDLLRTVGTWIRRLDTADTTRTAVHVYRVKYGEARQLARVLSDIFGGGSSGFSSDTLGSQVAPGSGLARTSSNADRLPGLSATTGTQSSTGAGSTSGGSRFGATTGGTSTGGTLGTAGAATSGGAAGSTFDARSTAGGGGGQAGLEGIKISADVSTNSLLVYASTENYRLVEQTIRQLDQPQAQVGIDATIAEVTLNNTLSYGVQFFLHNNNLSVSNIPTSPPGVASTVANGAATALLNRAFPGFNFLIGPEAQPKVILDALHAVTDVKILSNPSLVVIDNQVATLLVGDEIPVSTGTGNVLNSATSTSNTVVNSIDYRSTGIILRVIPRVSPNGNVRLDVEQEISQATNSTASTLTPTVSQRKVKSSVSVANGQTVLLAGLIQEKTELDRGGIPLLDQIPKVGDLFSHQTKSTVRTELIIFIRPQVIRDSVDASFVAEEFRTKLRGTIESPPPSLTRTAPLVR
ncbi:MAG: type II secretion system secretin GspD [Pseudolabrys sp.]